MKVNTLDSRNVRIIVIANVCLPRNSDCAPQSCGLLAGRGQVTLPLLLGAPAIVILTGKMVG